MKPDKLTMTLLYDHYGELLTGKQQTCFDLYYNQDYSLSEIAEMEGVSRQGVHDAVTRAEHTLLEMERVTGCLANARRLRSVLDTVTRCAGELSEAEDAHTRALAEQILAALDPIKE